MSEPTESGFAIGLHTLNGEIAIAIASAVPGHTMWHRFPPSEARNVGKNLIIMADVLEAQQAAKAAEQKPTKP